MFIPKSKYSKPKHTPGKEFLLRGKPYIGWYTELSTGEYYTGKAFDAKSLKLESIKSSTREETEFPFYSEDTMPTERDKQNKVWIRYFLQDKRTGRIIEVDKERYDLFRSKPYVTRTTVSWSLSKPVEDLVINGYPYHGAAHRNKQAVAAQEQIIPGISSYIKDYGQFVE